MNKKNKMTDCDNCILRVSCPAKGAKCNNYVKESKNKEFKPINNRFEILDL